MEKNWAKHFANEWSFSFCLNDIEIVAGTFDTSDEREISFKTHDEGETFLHMKIVCEVSKVAKASSG